jgi:hypothetical protein
MDIFTEYLDLELNPGPINFGSGSALENDFVSGWIRIGLRLHNTAVITSEHLRINLSYEASIYLGSCPLRLQF